MNRADLYLLSTPALAEQVNFCCRLSEKAFHDYKRFLPHEIGQTAKTLPPIIIDNQNLQDKLFLSSNLLILLATQLPDNTNRFDRMCILVPNIEEEIQHARVLYKELKQQNIEVHIHDMR